MQFDETRPVPTSKGMSATQYPALRVVDGRLYVEQLEGRDEEATNEEYEMLKRAVCRLVKGRLYLEQLTPSDDATLEDLHQAAWLATLSEGYTYVRPAFIANKMEWIHRDHLRSRRAEHRALRRYHQRLETKRDRNRYIQAKLVEMRVAANFPHEAREILVRKLAGYTVDEIAEQLSVSRRTINYRIAKLKGNPYDAKRL